MIRPAGRTASTAWANAAGPTPAPKAQPPPPPPARPPRAPGHDPVHGPHVLGVAAARGLETSRRSVAPVALALRVGLALAVEAGAAGNVVVQDHALAFPEAVRPGPERHHRPRDLVAEDAGGGQEALLDLLEVR